MDNILKYAIAVRAITGARYQGFGKMSQYLIVFNRKERRVHIWSSNALLSKLSPAEGEFKDEFVDFTGFPISNSSFLNAKEITAAHRISKIIAQTHKEKISMSLTPAFFQKVSSGI